MQLECVFFGPLREAVGEKTVVWETEATTAGELLVELQTAYPALRKLTDGEELADEIAVTRNKSHLSTLDCLDTELEDGDVIRLTTAVYGG